MLTASEGVTAENDVTAVPVTPEGPLSVRAYARHRGTSAPSVLRAIARGRLKACLVVDEKGKAKIADVRLADIEWAENTDLSRAPGYVKERGTVAKAKGGARVAAEPSALSEASTREKEARAKLAELEYQRKAGLLIDAKTAEDAMVDLVSRSRTKLLGVPNRIKSALPELTHAQVLVIDRTIREALEDLAAAPAKSDGAAA